MTKNQQGFTRIELVVVIAILGIVSTFAIPRFVSVFDTAKSASIERARGAVETATKIAYVFGMVNDVQDGVINMDGYSITLVNGYPSADNGDTGTICVAAGLAGFDCTDNNSDPATVTVSDLSGSCAFTYTEATSSSPVIGATDCI